MLIVPPQINMSVGHMTPYDHSLSCVAFSRTETLSKESDKLRKEIERLRRENKSQQAEIAHLKRVNIEQQTTLESLQNHIEVMQEQIILLRKALFSPRRERFILWQ